MIYDNIILNRLKVFIYIILYSFIDMSDTFPRLLFHIHTLIILYTEILYYLPICVTHDIHFTHTQILHIIIYRWYRLEGKHNNIKMTTSSAALGVISPSQPVSDVTPKAISPKYSIPLQLIITI